MRDKVTIDKWWHYMLLTSLWLGVLNMIIALLRWVIVG